MRGLILVLGAALALVLGVWLLVPRGAEAGALGVAGTGDETARPSAAAGASSRRAQARGLDPEGLPSEGATAGGGAEPATLGGTLLVHVTWQEDQSPAAGIVALVAPAARAPRAWDEPERRTDETGTLRLDGLAPGVWRVRLLHGPEASGEVKLASTCELHLSIPSGFTVEGVVVDTRGAGVQKARVFVSERWDPRVARVAAVADADGKFRLRALTKDHYVSARADGHAPSCSHWFSGKPGEVVPVRIVLPARGGTVRGVVFDRQGQPVAGAALLVGPEEGGPQGLREDGLATPGAPPLRLRSGPDGSFLATGVPAGEVVVQARAPGHGPWRGTVTVPVEAAVEVRIDLAPGTILTGTVRADDKPVEGALVMVGAAMAFASGSGSSGPDGSYRIQDLPGGEIKATAQGRNNQRDETQLVLGVGTQHEWNPLLRVGLEIRGRVIDERGEAVVGWRVVAQTDTEGYASFGAMTRREDGGFAITVPRDEPYRVMVMEPGDWRRFPRVMQDGVRPGAESLLLQVPALLATTATIVGVLQLEGSVPLVDPTLQIWNDRWRLWRALDLPAAGGPFELPGIPPGTLSLEVRDRNHPWVSLGDRTATAGTQLDLGTVRMVDPGFVAGTVTRRDGQPLPALDWNVVGEDHRSACVVTMTGSAFRSGPVAPGKYTVTARGDWVASWRREAVVRAGEETRLEVELEPAILRRLRITPAPGTELPRWLWVAALDEHDRPAWAQTLNRAKDGTMTAAISVPAGTYRIVVHRDQNRLAEATHGFTPGTANDLLELTVAFGR